MAHAKLSPSGASRWAVCFGSIPFNLGEDESSEWADDGTASHSVGSAALLNNIDCAALVGQTIDVSNDNGTVRRSYVVDDERASFVQVYVDAIRDKMHEGAVMLVEQRVDTGLSSLLYGKIDGTADAIVLDTTYELIDVNDLKYGMGHRVDAAVICHNPHAALGPVIQIAGVFYELNVQMSLYGLGALRDYGLLGNFRKVRMTAHQPRLDHTSVAEIDAADLIAWGVEFQKIIDLIDAGDSRLVPGESQCLWCRRKASCPELAKFVEQAVTNEFPVIGDLTEFGIASAYNKVPMVEMWVNAVTEAAKIAAREGRLPGKKMVKYRAGARKWKDEKAVEAIFKTTYRWTHEEMYNSKLISPADADKKLATLSPKRWEDLQPQIKRDDDVLTIVDDTDERPAVTNAGVAESFPQL